ncbi:MAG TPA: PEP-CTERM sorting domain-containing protein [Pedomonas sp.]|uniref:PEP-CTERM sorting domain-containing protein n=1 Tax=Pedomonas sp. TaxID=2976421 RepID=UPI002F3F9663
MAHFLLFVSKIFVNKKGKLVNLKLLLCALGLAIAGAGTANATLITKHWGFEAQTSGPISHHKGYFSYQYNTETQDAELTAIDFALGDYVFSLDDVLFDIDSSFILLGGKINRINGVTPNTNDFYLLFLPGQGFASFHYTQAGWNAIDRVTPVVTELAGPPVTTNPDPVDVAEPGTLGLIGAGLAGLALATLRRRKAAA